MISDVLKVCVPLVCSYADLGQKILYLLAAFLPGRLPCNGIIFSILTDRKQFVKHDFGLPMVNLILFPPHIGIKDVKIS